MPPTSPSVVLPPLPRLPVAVPRSGVSSDARRALRQLLGDVDRGLTVAFRDGADASVLARRRSESVDRMVAHVWTACLGEVDNAALFAVGGYGRGLLFPYSDVDLLALATAPEPARLREFDEQLGQYVHELSRRQVRTVPDAIRVLRGHLLYFMRLGKLRFATASCYNKGSSPNLPSWSEVGSLIIVELRCSMPSPSICGM